MKLKYPNVFSFVGGIIGLSMGASYYLSIMISQLFIGRPSSTWIIGIFWLPFFILKSGLAGFLIGLILWLLHHFFYSPRALSPTEIKIIKISLVFLICSAAAAGIIKIVFFIS